MKKILILVLGLAASSASFALPTEPIKPVATASLVGTNKVKLDVAPENATATVSLRDERGHVLYASTVDLTNGVHQNFDVSNLDNGVYRLSVSVGNQQTVNSFTLVEVPSRQVVTLQGD